MTRPTLFNGDNSFRLEVPENASRVTFTLESDVDVELLVRYGEDNDVQDGRPVSDYAADEFFAGTEEIVITRQSDPPLRSGTYFVSVLIFATGVVANCTLTAEVERRRRKLRRRCQATARSRPVSLSPSNGGRSTTRRLFAWE